MPALGPLVLPITIAVAAVGILIVLTPRLLRTGKGRQAKGVAFEMPCTVCQQRLAIPQADLEAIVGSEVALVVRECAAAQGKRLGGYRCPYCEAYHIFATDTSPPKWLVVNPFEPQLATNHCMDCRRPLQRPPWPQGEYEGRLHELKDLLPKYGLVCSRCGAICCVACCRDVTRGRTADQSLLCPRCFRGPVDKIHHF
ncbi:MAG: hypothetical protein QGD90_06095 [Candidatus Hydrogenedentes bacterium]|nr:hypothetical protein [Candidatus Hydrogenedentota bacterium]